MKNKHVIKPIILIMVSILYSIFLLSCDVIKDNTSVAFKVYEITPLAGATGISQRATVSITFSSDIDGTTATDQTVFMTDDKGHTVAGKVSAYGINVSFTPTDTLAKLTTYTVTIKSQLKDSAGRNLGSDYTISFTTGNDSA
jgi:hypothetical protein